MAKANQPTTETLLEWKNVCYSGSVANAIGMQYFSGVIRSGELTLATLERWHRSRDVVSMTMGLSVPTDGRVCYQGHCWQTIPYTEQFRLRGGIGRIFAGSAWIQNLTVGDNVQLALTHHGLIKRNRIKSRIHRIIEDIAAPQLTSVLKAMAERPAFVDPSLLQICQWIRAFCVKPQLLILERPLQFLNEEFHPLVVAAVNRLLAKGTGVLWLAGSPKDSEQSFDQPVIQWSLQGSLLQTIPDSGVGQEQLNE